MNTVVNKLLEVDKQARLLLDEAQQYYDRTLTDIEAEKQRLAAEYESKAKAHYEEIEIAEQTSVTDAVKETGETYARLTSEMDVTFEKEHAALEDALFARCIKE